MPSPTPTPKMVLIWPITASQRSWISNFMFWWPAGCSISAATAPRSKTSRLGRISILPGMVAFLALGATGAAALVFTHDPPADAGYHQGQRKPRQGVHEVVVVEGNHGQSADGRVTGRFRLFLRIDKVWRHVAQHVRGADGGHVTRIPVLRGRTILAQETAARLADAQQAVDVDDAGRRAGGDAGAFRHEAAVDEHGAAIGQAQWRHQPITAAQCRRCLHQGIENGEISTGESHMAVFIRLWRNAGPGCGSRCVRCGRMYALFDALDQVKLPEQALDLPGAQDTETGKQDPRQQGQCNF